MIVAQNKIIYFRKKKNYNNKCNESHCICQRPIYFFYSLFQSCSVPIYSASNIFLRVLIVIEVTVKRLQNKVMLASDQKTDLTTPQSGLKLSKKCLVPTLKDQNRICKDQENSAYKCGMVDSPNCDWVCPIQSTHCRTSYNVCPQRKFAENWYNIMPPLNLC